MPVMLEIYNERYTAFAPRSLVLLLSPIITGLTYSPATLLASCCSRIRTPASLVSDSAPPLHRDAQVSRMTVVTNCALFASAAHFHWQTVNKVISSQSSNRYRHPPLLSSVSQSCILRAKLTVPASAPPQRLRVLRVILGYEVSFNACVRPIYSLFIALSVMVDHIYPQRHHNTVSPARSSSIDRDTCLGFHTNL